MLLDVSCSTANNNALCYKIAMIVCVARSVDGHKEVGHDTSSAINGAL